MTTARRAVEDFFVVDDIVVVANKVLEESIAACIASRSAAARGDLCGHFLRDSVPDCDWWIGIVREQYQGGDTRDGRTRARIDAVVHLVV